jgi:hypothetical protein
MVEKNQRIAIKKVSLQGNEIQVELDYSGSVVKGSALCGQDEDGQILAATQALISAVNSIIPTPIVRRVSEIHRVKFKELTDPVIVTLVAVQIRGQEMLYTGAAKTDNGIVNAAVRATLDAINRPIGLYL